MPFLAVYFFEVYLTMLINRRMFILCKQLTMLNIYAVHDNKRHKAFIGE